MGVKSEWRVKKGKIYQCWLYLLEARRKKKAERKWTKRSDEFELIFSHKEQQITLTFTQLEPIKQNNNNINRLRRFHFISHSVCVFFCLISFFFSDTFGEYFFFNILLTNFRLLECLHVWFANEIPFIDYVNAVNESL